MFSFGYALLIRSVEALRVGSRRRSAALIREAIKNDPNMQKTQLFQDLFIKFPLTRQPDNASALHLAAVFCHLILGKYDEARRYYGSALRFQPNRLGLRVVRFICIIRFSIAANTNKDMDKMNRDKVVRNSISERYVTYRQRVELL